MTEKPDYTKDTTPAAHASSHETGGSDVLTVDRLYGKLQDNQPSTWDLVSSKPSTFTPAAHVSSHEPGGSDVLTVDRLYGKLQDNQPSTWDLVSSKPSTFTPTAHKTTHQNTGNDQISVAGLSGVLADAQPPQAHKTSHQDGGTDEISVTGLSGVLADAQPPQAHKTSHQDGGTDEISVAGLSGLLADQQHPLLTDFQKARMHAATAQTIPHAQWTKVNIDTIDFDPAGIANTVNHKITPTKAGYYLIAAQIYLSAIGYTAELVPALYIGGSQHSWGQRYPALAGFDATGTIIDIVYLSGAQDVEIYIYHWNTNSVTRDLGINIYVNYLSVAGPL